MINMSANGVVLGAETHRQAEQTVKEGIETGAFSSPSSALGRDIILGSTLAAIAGMLREDLPEDYPEAVAGHILLGLGVPQTTARDIAHLPLPELTSQA